MYHYLVLTLLDYKGIGKRLHWYRIYLQFLQGYPRIWRLYSIIAQNFLTRILRTIELGSQNCALDSRTHYPNNFSITLRLSKLLFSVWVRELENLHWYQICNRARGYPAANWKFALAYQTLLFCGCIQELGKLYLFMHFALTNYTLGMIPIWYSTYIEREEGTLSKIAIILKIPFSISIYVLYHIGIIPKVCYVNGKCIKLILVIDKVVCIMTWWKWKLMYFYFYGNVE